MIKKRFFIDLNAWTVTRQTKTKLTGFKTNSMQNNKLSLKKGVVLITLISSIFLISCGEKEKTEPELSSPLALNAENITENSFTAKWVGVADAESYEIDVSEKNDFSSYVNSYQAKPVSGVSLEINNLKGATKYYYRIRAVSGNTKSKNSNIISVTTSVPENTVLKDAAKDFYVGMIVRANRLTGTHHELFTTEFSSLTAEYEMKMNIMFPQENSYNWTAPDAIVNYADNNNINLHGHALIWHSSTPDWVENFSGTNAEFETMIKDYIKTVVTRYKGKVASWDVVNEAFQDGDGELRNSVFKQKLGDDYIAKCFEWAHQADPDALLFYNDYSMCSNITKQNAVFDMVDDFQSRNIPIHGIGFQMHISYNGPSRADIQAATDRIVERNLKAHFSELDIRANPNNNLTSLSDSRSLEQKEKYKEIAEIYSAIPAANKYALTIWGLKDDESWLLNHYGHIDWPLLYDNSFSRKDAYYGFLEGLLVTK